jgi:hypothetical protein
MAYKNKYWSTKHTKKATSYSKKPGFLSSSSRSKSYNNRNQFRSSPLQQSWQQGQNKSEVSSQQTLDNDQSILTEHIDKFGTAYDDESLQREETLNGSQIYMENYDDIYYNNPIISLSMY